MRRTYFLGGLLILVLAAAFFFLKAGSSTETVFEPKITVKEAAPMCPWREPDSDMKRFFPAANRRQTEVRILSGARLELEKRLGRPVAPEEQAFYLNQIYEGRELLGTILTKRVKGEFGAIEIVLAVNPRGEVSGVKLQRMREPRATAEFLENPAWLGRYAGKGADQIVMASENGVAGAPVGAKISALAIEKGIQSMLILLEAAERHGAGTARVGVGEAHH